jgi:hypothetical protein
MTKRTALRICRRLWIWLYEYPDQEKMWWPEWETNGGDLDAMDCFCPCCDYAGTDAFGRKCRRCPLLNYAWSATHTRGTRYNLHCCRSTSPYLRWDKALRTSRACRKRNALIIVRACEAALGKYSPKPYEAS